MIDEREFDDMMLDIWASILSDDKMVKAFRIPYIQGGEPVVFTKASTSFEFVDINGERTTATLEFRIGPNAEHNGKWSPVENRYGGENNDEN